MVCVGCVECVVVPSDPCTPTPCGPNSQCRVVAGQPACVCLPNYIGRPPNCRPECSISAECPGYLTCQNERCVDPCPGSCGPGALCRQVNHNAICTCPPGLTGDPFTGCSPQRKNIVYSSVSLCFRTNCVFFSGLILLYFQVLRWFRLFVLFQAACLVGWLLVFDWLFSKVMCSMSCSNKPHFDSQLHHLNIHHLIFDSWMIVMTRIECGNTFLFSTMNQS